MYLAQCGGQNDFFKHGTPDGFFAKTNKASMWHFLLSRTGSSYANLLQRLEKFTCLMSGCPPHPSLNEVRTFMLRKMVGEDENLTIKSKVELSCLPPCQDAHVPHVKPVNYRVAF